jgi:hypothetical protein
VIPLDAKLSRCYGYGCNLKRQCDRFLTIEKDKTGGLYAYANKLCNTTPRDGITDCDFYINDMEL